MQATPIFFYSVSAQAKALIDRTQALWARRYVIKQDFPGPERQGVLLAVGATHGKLLFVGARLVAKYFFDAIDAAFCREGFFDDTPEAKVRALQTERADLEAFVAYRQAAGAFLANRDLTGLTPPTALGRDLERVALRTGFRAEVVELRAETPELFPGGNRLFEHLGTRHLGRRRLGRRRLKNLGPYSLFGQLQ